MQNQLSSSLKSQRQKLSAVLESQAEDWLLKTFNRGHEENRQFGVMAVDFARMLACPASDARRVMVRMSKRGIGRVEKIGSRTAWFSR